MRFSRQQTRQDDDAKTSHAHVRGTDSRLRHRSRLCCIVFVVVFLVIAIALGVGLGVGLTQGGGGSSGSGSSPTTTPLPPINNTNATSGSFWRPSVGTSWQIVLEDPVIDTSLDVSVYDIDLFINSAQNISNLHALGKKVICYFSAGSYEPDRPDSSQFLPSDKGDELDGWPGEYWLNTSSFNVRNIMTKRLELASQKGCDGVDPDNVDGYDNTNGLNLTTTDAVDYLTFLAIETHGRNMSIGLKNAGAIIPTVLNMMQWDVNEQCVQYDECDLFRPFITAGKPVFHIEYPDGTPGLSRVAESKYCNNSSEEGFSTVLKNMDLDEWLYEC